VRSTPARPPAEQHGWPGITVPKTLIGRADEVIVECPLLALSGQFSRTRAFVRYWSNSGAFGKTLSPASSTPGLTPFLRDAKRSEALVYGRASFIGISITADTRIKQIAAARMTTTILSVI
jgi:hypothetical protein